MKRWLALAAVTLAAAAPASAAGITGKYLEARTCDVYTGPCFANAEMNLTGKHAILAWKVEKGSVGDARLDGLSVVALVQASDTLGLEQKGPAKAVLIVDSRASAAQKAALVRLAQKQGGDLLANVLAVESAPVEFTFCPCAKESCTVLKAGSAHVQTKCIDPKEHKVCGNDGEFYPPLARGVKAKAAYVVEHGYTSKLLGRSWAESDRRGAYVGSFEMK